MSVKPLIYAVDDDVSMNKIMEARFKKFGCEVETFTEAHTVLAAIRKKRPNLLLLDLDLGAGLSGFDVIEAVRLSIRADFPIIVVSSESRSAKVAHALEMGASDFVVKPPFRFQFEEKVAEYIQAENLALATPVALRTLKTEDQTSKISFSASIRDVSPLGFTLLSSHLIRKGALIRLSGNVFKEIIPSVEALSVTVLGSATRVVDNQRLYEIRVEVDTTEDSIIQDIRAFLAKSKGG